MESINFQIPAPDFSFEDIAKDKAKDIIRFYLNGNGLIQYVSGANNELSNNIESEIYTLYNKTERLLCISELINYLIQDVIKLNSNPYNRYSDDDKIIYSKGINKLKYILYSLASTVADYNFDTNAFTNDEVVDLNQKIDSILSVLEVIKMGQDVLGEEIEELKDELNSLKSAYVLGKKTWKQKATGIVVSFVSKKGSDAAWEAIKPYIKDFLVNHSSEIIHKLLA